MNEVKDIVIKAWDKPVALMTLHNDGKIYFEYTKENRINFSPIKLSDMQKTYEFSSLSFQNGVCGLVHDSLPGKYGFEYMDMFFRKNNRDIPTTLERLLFIGDNALGALSFEPAEHNASKIEQIMDIKEFYKKSKEALSGVGPIEMSTIIALSNSAGGGARAKGIVGYNPKNQEIFVGQKHHTFPKEYIPSIVKFDEKNIYKTDMIEDEWKEASVHNKTEYAYHLLAKKAGIKMSDCYLAQSEDGFHFVTERFDRKSDGERLHMHSLSGLFHHNPAETTFGYENLFRAGRMLNIPYKDHEQIFKLLVFNLLFANRDDHSRNFSYLMDKDGTWRFSPAYDLTFSLNRSHQMLISYVNGYEISRKHLLKFAKENDIKNAEILLDELIEIKEKYLENELINLDMPHSWIKYINDKSADVLIRLKG